MNRIVLLGLVVAIASGSWGAQALPGPAPAGAEGVQAIEWKHLVPAGYNPDKLLEKYDREVANLRDGDPRAERLAQDLRRAWDDAPVVESLNNKVVKLTGFLVTLEGDGKAVSEFLLVPYFGACMHVPPPPSNQIVLVRTRARPFKVNQMFDMVSVTGRIRTERARNELASASYVIESTRVEPYVPPRAPGPPR